MTSGHPAHKPAEVSNCEGEVDNTSVSRGALSKRVSTYLHVSFFLHLKCMGHC